MNKYKDLVNKTHKLVEEHNNLVSLLNKREQERLKEYNYRKNIEDIYCNSDVDYKTCGKYIENLSELEKKEVYKYIKRQKINTELNCWDYFINVLGIYDTILTN